MLPTSSSINSLGLSSDPHKYVQHAIKQRPIGYMSPHQAQLPVRFYEADVVRNKAAGSKYTSGRVSRCPHDELDQHALSFPQSGLNRALKEDEVGIQWEPSRDREIVSAKTLELIDRVYQIGSLCKLSEQDTQSGVVIKTIKTLRLQNVFTKDIIEHAVPEDDVVKARSINRGDHVIANDWVGEVEDILEHLIISVPGMPSLIKTNDLSGEGVLGKLPSRLRSLPLGIPGVECVEIRPDIVQVNWIALNQRLTPEEQAQRPKPADIWTDLEKLTVVKPFADEPHEMGDLVVFRSDELRKKHGGKRTIYGSTKVPAEAMTILETERKLIVAWQDGTRTQENAKSVIPFDVLDEHDAWPGEWVWWKSEDQKAPRIVQSVDSAERTALVRMPPQSGEEIETVPMLEIDTHGADHSLFCLHRGDTVLVCARRTDFQGPFVTSVGDPYSQFDESAMQNAIFENRESFQNSEFLVHTIPKQFSKPTANLDWYGTVTDLLLDGSCQITLANGETIIETLDKVHIFRDSRHGLHGHEFHLHDLDHDHDEDMAEDGLGSFFGGHHFDGDEDMYGDFYDDDGYDGYGYRGGGDYSGYFGGHDIHDVDDDMLSPWMDSYGHEVSEDRDEWEDMSDVDEVESQTALAISTPQVKAASNETHDKCEAKETASVAEIALVSSKVEAKESKSDSALSSMEKKAVASGSTSPKQDADLSILDTVSSWNQFAVLESAPASHGFYKKKLEESRLGPAFLKRLKKEFKVLQSSLPDTILVRAYEDRTDLLRVLIFGSEGTPYENAPFLLDFQLTSDFPNAPPIAFFHSWTNEHGRVSPNLYEDGKVCLSVLGTWSGQAEENWNPIKSSLLQVFVSIQALVLVREPYYTEPAYEKLKGTEDSQLNSRHYSEKAYILSRGFVRHAFEKPIDDFEGEIKTYYLERGNLEKVISRATALIEQGCAPVVGSVSKGSKTHMTDEPLSNLTKGGIIMLSRSVKALQSILDTQSSA